MEYDAKKKHSRHSARQVLFCEGSGECSLTPTSGDVVSSPIACLAKALDGKPRIIVIHFAEPANGEREPLVELCGVLKRNSRTKRTPILALLHSRHRKLLEDLEQAGVEYVKYVGDTPLNSLLMNGLIGTPGPDDLLERQLARVCPYLHYSPIDSEREMVVCGAYLDRLVLGKKWLHMLCEHEAHLRCEYFLNPRVDS
jgi:hypothetical protein